MKDISLGAEPRNQTDIVENQKINTENRARAKTAMSRTKGNSTPAGPRQGREQNTSEAKVQFETHPGFMP